MSEDVQTTSGSGWIPWLSLRAAELRQREGQVFLILSLVIGAVTGLAVVAFILLTEHMGMRLYPVGGARWRRVLFPVMGSLSIGYLLYRYFPNARGSGVPQTKAALFAREGRITLRTVLGKFFCTSCDARREPSEPTGNLPETLRQERSRTRPYRHPMFATRQDNR